MAWHAIRFSSNLESSCSTSATRLEFLNREISLMLSCLVFNLKEERRNKPKLLRIRCRSFVHQHTLPHITGVSSDRRPEHLN